MDEVRGFFNWFSLLTGCLLFLTKRQRRRWTCLGLFPEWHSERLNSGDGIHFYLHLFPLLSAMLFVIHKELSHFIHIHFTLNPYCLCAEKTEEINSDCFLSNWVVLYVFDSKASIWRPSYLRCTSGTSAAHKYSVSLILWFFFFFFSILNKITLI